MARPLRVEFDGAIYHVTPPGTPDETSSMTVRIVTKRDARIVQAVHRYGYSQRGCRSSGPALRYGQPVGKQALIQETRPQVHCVICISREQPRAENPPSA